jgi:hypothetical protein
VLPDGRTRGSTLQRFGFDPDGDGAFEYYSNETISLSDVDTRAIGWHTGYWFGIGLGLSERELPAPFRDDSVSNGSGSWWEQPP